jgi:hypothetical protein
MKSTNINAFHQRHCERLQVMRQSMLFVTPLKPHRLTCVIASGDQPRGNPCFDFISLKHVVFSGLLRAPLRERSQ